VLANRKGNNCAHNDNNVHYHKNCLELAHDLGQGRCQYSMEENTGEEDGVNISVARSPVAITCNDDSCRSAHGRINRTIDLH
jgi:hypothetical protein